MLQLTYPNNKENKAENLLLVGILSYYLAQTLISLTNNGLFNNMGADFLSFWSSGYIANTKGITFIYDLNAQATVQQFYAPLGEKLGVVPTPFLPVFILPFQLMATIPPGISFFIWTLINLGTLFLYLKNRVLLNLPAKYLWMTMLIIPVFQNTYFGQVEVWLMIFTSEYLISTIRGDFLKSGLWLGLLLLKPQLLILIIPYMLLNRSWKILAGFFITSFFILGSSYILVGINGLVQLKNLWLGYSTGLPSNSPEIMMNWRMLGLHIGGIISPFAGNILVILGSIITLYLCLPLFLPQQSRINSSPAIPLLGIFSATLAITWHSHQHMAMILIPFLFTLLRQGAFPIKLFKAWVYIPPLIYFAVIPIATLIVLGILPMLDAFGGLITGTCFLLFNLSFTYTASKLNKNVINIPLPQ